VSGLSLAQRIAARGLTGVLDAMSAAHCVTADEILGGSRLARVVLVRHALMRDLRARGYSYPEIGWLFGRNHTTVMYACRSVEERKARREVVKASADLGPGVCSSRSADARGALRVI